MVSVVHVATPAPKKSRSSVQIGQSSSKDAATAGQSRSSLRAILALAAFSTGDNVSWPINCTATMSESSASRHTTSDIPPGGGQFCLVVRGFVIIRFGHIETDPVTCIGDEQPHSPPQDSTNQDVGVYDQPPTRHDLFCAIS